MTGILPIKKYGTYSALNMFSEYSMTNPRQLAQYVGFTEEYEALKIYIDMNFDGLKDDVLTLLIHLGYLAYDFEDKCVYIPNNEVRGEYVNAVSVSGWGEVSDALRNSAWTLRSIWERRPEQVSKGIKQHKVPLSRLRTNSILKVWKNIKGICY